MGNFIHLEQIYDGKLDHLVHMYGGMLPSLSFYAWWETVYIAQMYDGI